MINKVILTGRLTAAPELKMTPSSVPVTDFSIAAERRYAAKGEERIADFVDCIAWRNTAEFIAKHFGKGDMIAVVGSLQTRNYEVDGKKRKDVKVVIDEAHFCGTKAKADTSTDAPEEPHLEAVGDDDDLPF